MEITNEVRAKVFAQYLGQKTTGSALSLKWLNEYYENNFTSIKLILKPLSEISDKDAIEVAKIANHWINDKNLMILKGKMIIEDWIKNKLNYLSGWQWFFIYQLLQSKGYDFPRYLLDGKTLFEAGLCIYE